MRFVNPKNDVAFKKIFSDENHKGILISFLNAVLNLEGVHEIADLTILNPYQAPKLDAREVHVADVRAIDKRGVTFIVEMQAVRRSSPGVTQAAQHTYVARLRQHPCLL